MLSVRGLVVEVGGKRIVDGASLQVHAGEKVGLVGRNGAGKTTLLRVLGGADRPRSGLVERAPLTGYLSQDPRSDAVPDDTTVLSHVLSGRGLDDLLARTEKLRIALEENPSTENIERFSTAQEEFEAAGGDAAESEVRKLADGVGLREDRLDLHLGALSGGERRRAELVRILFGGSDLLLLDEPTNHIDADARTWLLRFLRSYRGALVVVSHDLDLLDEAITRVVEIDRPAEEGTGSLVEYKGTYSQYLEAARGRESATPSWPSASPRDRAAQGPGRRHARPDGQARGSPRTSTSVGRRSRRRRSRSRGEAARRWRCASRSRRRRVARCSPRPSCTSRSARSTCSVT